MERKRTGRNADSAAEVLQIIDDEFPPGSEQRQRLEAAADDAERLLRKHGYGHLLDDGGPASGDA
jgi:hypothetical protein